MKKILFLTYFIFSLGLFANDNDYATKGDIKALIHHLDKRFEQIDKRFEQVDKRFEQVDKRFEQVDKRFDQIDRRFDQVDKRLDFHEKLIYLLMGLIFASPFIAIYLKDKKDIEFNQKYAELMKLIIILKEMAKKDKDLESHLKIANFI